MDKTSILKEYMGIMGSKAYGYQYFSDMVQHVESIAHTYTDPWKIL